MEVQFVQRPPFGYGIVWRCGEVRQTAVPQPAAERCHQTLELVEGGVCSKITSNIFPKGPRRPLGSPQYYQLPSMVFAKPFSIA